MDISKMTVTEIEKKLEQLWNKADKLSSKSVEYDEIVDKVLYIRNYCRENYISLSRSIAARF
ncbi:MAG: hypothetical protein IKV59_05955 [Lachnospiraceae bacterium]|nr:hypothetical protein [Lachnospiraceae bacterium]